MAENILTKITEERRLEVDRLQREVSRERLLEASCSRTHHSLAGKLSCGPGPKVIAEVKKASPSAGVLVNDYRPGEIAVGYEAAGACAISVLTEPNHFKGSGEHLKQVRESTRLPVLRKDFICTEYQILEAAAWGADVVLLIVAALERDDLKRLYECASCHGLEALVESHTIEEMETALSLDDAIVGVNSRNLKTLKTDLTVAGKIAEGIPPGRLSVAESGIKGAGDIRWLSMRGYDGFLVGEMLLREDDPAGTLRKLMVGCGRLKREKKTTKGIKGR